MRITAGVSKTESDVSIVPSLNIPCEFLSLESGWAMIKTHNCSQSFEAHFFVDEGASVLLAIVQIMRRKLSLSAKPRWGAGGTLYFDSLNKNTSH